MENLTNLPILVLDEIFKNLNTEELKTLRTTCRTLNLIINQPKHLKRMGICIKYKKQLMDIVANYNRPIYNVVFDYRNLTDFATRSKFVEKFNSTLTQVKFKTFDTKYVEILNEPSLESHNMTMVSFYPDEKISPVLFNKKILKELQRDEIRIRDANYSIKMFLQKCSRLNFVRLPIWHSPIESLINSFEKRSKKLTIYFGEFDRGTIIDVNDAKEDSLMYATINKNREIHGITPANLLSICENSKRLKLRNVQPASLPTRIAELTESQKSDLDACVETITIVHDAIENYSLKYVPPKAQVKLEIYGVPEEFLTYSNFNITTIYWRVGGTIGVKNNPKDLNLDSAIYQDLFKNGRNELLQNYVAQGRPIYIEDSLLDFTYDLCVKLRHLKIVHLFAACGFRDYNFALNEWKEKEMGNGEKDAFKFEF